MKKHFKLLFLIFIILFGSINVKAASNPYAQTGPYGTNCTWYAWKMAYERAGVSLPGWGNAKNWYNDAINSGYSVGTTPRANSIIVWGGWTSYGHVGYVESVEGNILHVWDSTGPCIDEEDPSFKSCIANGVSEETDKICYANAKRIACKYTISPDRYGITGYIYLDSAPKTPVYSNSGIDNETVVPVVIKSSNNNLNSIKLSEGTIKFDKDVLEYKIEVERKVDTIKVDATVEDSKATLQGTGNHKLNVGLNEIKLLVIAEDGKSKEYIIKVIREERPKLNINNNIKLEEVEVKRDKKQMIILISIICVLISSILCLVVLLIRKILKNRKKSDNIVNK